MQPEYYIKEGVRRAVATREAGRPDIPARIIELGKPDVFVRLPLGQLRSPKPVIPRDHRYIRYTEYPIMVLGQELDPIDVEPLGARGQSVSVPLLQVVLT